MGRLISLLEHKDREFFAECRHMLDDYMVEASTAATAVSEQARARQVRNSI